MTSYPKNEQNLIERLRILLKDELEKQDNKFVYYEIHCLYRNLQTEDEYPITIVGDDNQPIVLLKTGKEIADMVEDKESYNATMKPYVQKKSHMSKGHIDMNYPGLYFCGTLTSRLELPKSSPYGPIRFTFTFLQSLVKYDFYLFDYYEITKPEFNNFYIVLLFKLKTNTDNINLQKLSHDNVVFKYSENNFKLLRGKGIWVEFFYMDVRVSMSRLTLESRNVQVTGRNTKTTR